MREQIEFEMLGGAPEARLRRRRPGADDLPWGTIDVRTFSPKALHEARAMWTNGIFTEYASAAAFSAMAGAFLECRAPLDLTAAAADIVVDEIDHATIASRLVMELGGAAPYRADFTMVAPATTPGISPLLRAAELALKTSCVGEALSVPALARSLELADHPLTRAVLERLLGDEGPHSRLGTWFFEWADLTDEDRAHLANVAFDAIAVYQPLWANRCESCEAPSALGGTPVREHVEAIVSAVRTRIAAPLAKLGIMVDRAKLDALLAI